MKRMGEYDLSGLSDSRLLYMRKIPKFTYIFTIAVVLIIIGVGIWAGVTVKAEEIETQGIVVTEGSMDIVPQTNGTISEICSAEGQNVNKDDVLFRFDSCSLEKERSSYVTTLSYYTERLGFVEKALDALDNKLTDNPFVDSGNEREFYVMYQNYLIQYNATVGEEAKDSLRYQTMSSMYTERSTCNSQIASANSSISNYDSELTKYTVKALCSGTVHYDSEMKKGIVLQSGTSIGSVSSDSDKKYVELYVSSSQRAKMEVGQECHFTVNGLLQSEYGSIDGKIESITSDASLTDSGAYFKVKVSYDADHMTDSKGNKVDIVNGMTVNTWCVYEKSTYLKYFLDKLGIRL